MPTYNEALLGHWHQAGDLDREIHYLKLVAENLVKVTAEHERAHILLYRGLAKLPLTDGRRVGLLNMQANSYMRQGQYTDGKAVIQQIHSLARQTGDLAGLAESFDSLGEIARYQGDYAVARDYHQQSLAIRRTLGDQRGIALSLNNLGNVVFHQSDYTSALDYRKQGLSIMRALGDKQGVAMSLSNLGFVTYAQKDYTIARDYMQQSLAICRSIGDRWGIANCLNNLSFVYLQLNSDQANTVLHQALVIARDIETKLLVLEAIAGFAWLYILASHPIRAARLVGLVQHHPAHTDDVQLRLDELFPQLEGALPSTELQTALEIGKRLDLDTVVAGLWQAC
ncbi:MAG: tetratricopeptide repeat protein [Gammaproteobacteria bacterium]|nr:tetratricopeptide repeat protein [Gammaproteobacteria bacterium]